MSDRADEVTRIPALEHMVVSAKSLSLGPLGQTAEGPSMGTLEEMAWKTMHAADECDHSGHGASPNPDRECLATHFADALHAYAEKAKREEREACAKLAEPLKVQGQRTGHADMWDAICAKLAAALRAVPTIHICRTPGSGGARTNCCQDMLDSAAGATAMREWMRMAVTEKQAVAFAYWLLDTFGKRVVDQERPPRDEACRGAGDGPTAHPREEA